MVYDVDVSTAVKLTFVFVGLGSKQEYCRTASMMFDREGYTNTRGKTAQNLHCQQYENRVS